jgi:hypothetical protein
VIIFSKKSTSLTLSVEYLRLSGTAIQKDQLQPCLLSQKLGKSTRISRTGFPLWRFQQQLKTIGMTTIMKNSNAIAIFRMLEHIQNFFSGCIGSLHNLTQTRKPGFFQRLPNLALFIGKVAQIRTVSSRTLAKARKMMGLLFWVGILEELLFSLFLHLQACKEMDSISEMESISLNYFYSIFRPMYPINIFLRLFSGKK